MLWCWFLWLHFQSPAHPFSFHGRHPLFVSNFFSHFLPTFLATSLPGHNPTCDVCTPALPNPSALNCDPLSLSLSVPLERVFLKFLSHYSKRIIVEFAIKKQEQWVGLSMNNLKNIQSSYTTINYYLIHLPFFEDRVSWWAAISCSLVRLPFFADIIKKKRCVRNGFDH